MDPHFVGDDPRQRGFAQSRGAMEEHMIQGFLAHFGRVNEYGQVFLGLFLAIYSVRRLGRREPSPSSSPRRDVVIRGVVWASSWESRCSCRPASLHLIIFRRAWRTISSKESPSKSSPFSATAISAGLYPSTASAAVASELLFWGITVTPVPP